MRNKLLIVTLVVILLGVAVGTPLYVLGKQKTEFRETIAELQASAVEFRETIAELQGTADQSFLPLIAKPIVQFPFKSAIQFIEVGTPVKYQFDQWVNLRSGATAGWSILGYVTILHGTGDAANWQRLDWGKRIIGQLFINQESFFATSIIRTQIMNRAVAPVLGDLTVAGVGVKVVGTRWYFENHDGTGRTETDLGVDLPGIDRTGVVIFDHDPSVPQIRVRAIIGNIVGDWITITTNVPTTEPGVIAWMCWSVENGATAASAEASFPAPTLWFWLE